MLSGVTAHACWGGSALGAGADSGSEASWPKRANWFRDKKLSISRRGPMWLKPEAPSLEVAVFRLPSDSPGLRHRGDTQSAGFEFHVGSQKRLARMSGALSSWAGRAGVAEVREGAGVGANAHGMAAALRIARGSAHRSREGRRVRVLSPPGG